MPEEPNSQPTEVLSFISESKQKFSEEKHQSANSCAVCMELFVEDTSIVELDCHEGHVFHYDCLESWFKFKMTENAQVQFKCPTCRTPVKITS